MTVLDQMRQEGWRLKQEFLDGPAKGLGKAELIKLLLKTDLREVRDASAPNELQKNESNQLPTPIILQVTNTRNVTAPKSNEQSKAAPRLIKLTLTDGSNYVQGLEVESIQAVSLNTPPGTKIKLTTSVPFHSGYIFLDKSNTTVLGGIVDELYDKWKMSQSVTNFSRILVNPDGTSPPPWVPFGHRINADSGKSNFKSLKDPHTNTKENDAFQQHRDQTVQELAKESTSSKVFGGGKQMLDTNVQKIINAGFTMDEAQRALQRSRNDVNKAMRDLKAMSEGRLVAENETFRGRGRGGRRGRGRRGDNYEDEFSAPSKPSGPALLCDYLGTHLNLPPTSEPVAPSVPEYRENHRGNRNPRGRGRGRGRGDYHRNSSGQTPNLQSDYWPELGLEVRANANQSNDDRISSTGDRTSNYNGRISTTGERNPNYNSRSSTTGDRTSSYNGRNSTTGDRTSNYNGRNSTTGDRTSNYNGRNSTTGDRTTSYNGRNSTTGDRTSSYNGRNSTTGDRTSSYNGRNSTTGDRTSNYNGRISTAGDRTSNHNARTFADERTSNPYGRFSNTGNRNSNTSYTQPQRTTYSANRNSESTGYTVKQRDLISQFKESMILSGVYEDESNASFNRAGASYGTNQYRGSRGRGNYRRY